MRVGHAVAIAEAMAAATVAGVEPAPTWRKPKVFRMLAPSMFILMPPQNPLGTTGNGSDIPIPRFTFQDQERKSNRATREFPPAPGGGESMVELFPGIVCQVPDTVVNVTVG